MRRVLLLLCLLVCASAIAQKMPDDYLREGNVFLEKKKYPEAAASFRYVVRNHPRADVFPLAFHNLALTYNLLHRFDSAKVMYAAILRSDFNELQPIGGGIMDDPYANYRHRASDALSRIHEKEGRLDSALHYFALSDTAYPYEHFCGNEYAAQAVYAAGRYADLLGALRRPIEARAYLLKEVFLHEGLTSKEPVLTRLKAMLQADKARRSYRAAFDRSLAAMRQVEMKRQDYAYTEYRIEFLGVEITIPERFGIRWSLDEDEKSDEEAVREAVRKSEFYELITALEK